MSKLDPIKEKIGALKAQLGEKLGRFGLGKKGAPASAPASGQAPPSNSLGEIYRKGSTGTRLQVLLMVLFAIVAIASTGIAVKKFMKRFQKAADQSALKKEYADSFGEINRRVIENASVLSLGKFTVNAFVEGKSTHLSMDVWVRTDGAPAADFVQKWDTALYDKVVEALNELYHDKVNLLSEEGKQIGKTKVIAKLNEGMQVGKIEDIYFYNLVSQ